MNDSEDVKVNTSKTFNSCAIKYLEEYCRFLLNLAICRFFLSIADSCWELQSLDEHCRIVIDNIPSCKLCIILQIFAESCISLQNLEDLCKILQILAKSSISLQNLAVLADSCRILQILAESCRTLQILAESCRTLQILADPCFYSLLNLGDPIQSQRRSRYI